MLPRKRQIIRVCGVSPSKCPGLPDFPTGAAIITNNKLTFNNLAFLFADYHPENPCENKNSENSASEDGERDQN
jgi:hypothetical protein